MKIKSKILVILCILFLNCVGPSKEITIGLSSRPRTLNPLMYKEFAILSLLCNVYEPLISEDETYNIKPVLAKYWERKDSLTWYIYIRRGVRFHNGKPLNASDVVYTFYYPLRIKNSEFRSHEIYVDTVFALNDSVAVFKTRYPYDFLLRELIMYFIIPEGFEPDSQMPCGTGPYKVEENDSNFISLKRWKNYWGEKPFFKNAKLIFVEDSYKRVRIFIESAADIIDYVPLEYSDSITKYGKLLYTPESSVRILEFNLRVPPFNNKEFRKAVSMCIDRNRISRVYYKGLSSPANQFFPAGVREYIPDFGPLDYDTMEAEKALSNVDYEVPIVMDYAIAVKSLGDSIVRQLRSVGIKVIGNPLPANEFWEKIKSGKSQLHLLAVVFESPNAYFSLANYFHTPSPGSPFGVSNRTSYSRKDVDSLIEEAIRTYDVEIRAKLARQIQEIVMEDMPVCPIVFERKFYGAKNDIIWKPTLDQRIYLTRIKRQ